MKLLLTSCGWEYNKNIAREFLRLAGKKPTDIKIFLVTTARKKDRDWKWVGRQIKMITAIGILKENIRVFSLDRKIKKNELADADVIYVCGGNTFLYLDGIRKTGLDKEITRAVKRGYLYYGISAGSIVAGPDIAFIAPLDDPSVVRSLSTIKLTHVKGLDLTNVAVAPHYNKKEYISIIDGFQAKSKFPIMPLTDKQALEIVGRKKKIIE
jgi:dipeptidase E